MSDKILKEGKLREYLEQLSSENLQDRILSVEIHYQLGNYGYLLKKYKNQNEEFIEQLMAENYLLRYYIIWLKVLIRVNHREDARKVINDISDLIANLSSNQINDDKSYKRYVEEFNLLRVQFALREQKIEDAKKLLAKFDYSASDYPMSKWLFTFVMAQIDLFSNKLDVGMERILQAKELASSLLYPDPLLITNFILMNFYYRKDEYDKFNDIQAESKAIMKNFENSYHLGLLENMQGIRCIVQGLNETAISYFEKAMTYFTGSPDQSMIAAINNNLATQYNNTGNYEQALQNYQTVMNIHEEMNNEVGLGLVYYNISSVFYNSGYFENARYYNERALEIREKEEIGYVFDEDYSLIIQILIELNQLETAFKYLDKALEIEKSLKTPRKRSNIHFSAAQLYLNNGELDKAISHFNKCLKLREKIGNKIEVAEVYTGIAKVHYLRNKFNQSRQYYEIAIQHAKDSANEMGYAKIAVDYIQFHFDIGNTNYAKETLQEVKTIEFSKENFRIKANLIILDAWFYFYDGKYDTSLSLISEAISLYESIGTIDQLARGYAMIAKICEILGELQSAEEALSKSIHLEEQTGKIPQLAYLLFSKALIHLQLDKPTSDILQQINELDPTQQFPLIKVYTTLYDAICSIQSGRLLDIGKAQEALKQLLNTDVLVLTKMLIYEQLLDLLLYEFNLTKSKSVEAEIEKYFVEYYEFGQDSGVQVVIIDALMFKMRFDNFRKSTKSLEEMKQQVNLIIDSSNLYYYKYQLETLDKELGLEEHLNDSETTPYFSIHNFSLRLRKYTDNIDQFLHSTPRLMIILFLLNHSTSTYKELQDHTGLSAGNLGRHCDRLAEAGIIEKFKDIDTETQAFKTHYRLTPEGISEFKQYRTNILGFLQLDG